MGIGTAWAAGTAGTLDLTFGTGGVADGGGSHYYFQDAVALSDGSYLTLGSDSRGADTAYVVKRFTSAGALDTLFGPDGTGVVDVLGAPGAVGTNVSDLAVGPDGTIFVAGRRTYERAGRGKKTTTVTTGSVMALTSSGDLKTGFGIGGYLDHGTGIVEVHAVGTASDYDLILAYDETVEVSSGGGGKKKRGGSTSSRALVLHRVDDTGADVTSFGADGKVVDDLSATTDDLVRTVEVDASGRIVVVLAQYTAGTGSAIDVLLTRYGSDGALDTSFGTSGRLSVDSLGTVSDIAIDADGKRIIVAAHNGAADPKVVRYTEGGAFDTTFDVPSIADTTNSSEYDTWTRNVIVDSAGRVCVCVWYGLTNFDFTVVRCLASGARDTAFGPNSDGIAEIVDDSDRDDPKALVLDADGDLVIVGEAPISGSSVGVLVRWLGD